MSCDATVPDDDHVKIPKDIIRHVCGGPVNKKKKKK